MNKINFANVTKKTNTNWSSKLAVGLIITVFSIITFLQIKQWNRLHRIKKEKSFHTQKISTLNSVLEEKMELEKKETLIRKKLNKINKAQNNPHIYFETFNAINNALLNRGSLESLNMFRKQINLTVCCLNIKEATRFMQGMIELPYVSSLQLVSIYPKANLLSFKMSGKLA